VYKILRRLDRNINEKVRLPKVEAKEAVQFFVDLWTTSDNADGNVIPPVPEDERVDVFTMEDLKNALINSKSGKAPGENDLAADLFKYAPGEVHKRLLALYNRISHKEKVPKDFTKAVVVLIYKKGNMAKMINYRGISLLCVAYKTLVRMVAKNLSELAQSLLHESQNGFRKGRSCTDAGYTIKLIMEKRVEFNQETYLCFVDFGKAYDRVNRRKLFEILKERGIQEVLIRILQAMYAVTEISVRLESETSEYGRINRGVRQGCPASCILFNIYIDEIIKRRLLTNAKGIMLETKNQIQTVCLLIIRLSLRRMKMIYNVQYTN